MPILNTITIVCASCGNPVPLICHASLDNTSVPICPKCGNELVACSYGSHLAMRIHNDNMRRMEEEAIAQKRQAEMREQLMHYINSMHIVPPVLQLPDPACNVIKESKKKSNKLYEFNLSAIELLDLTEVAKDVTRDTPVLLVKIKGSDEHTAVIVHNSIMLKADMLAKDGIKAEFTPPVPAVVITDDAHIFPAKNPKKDVSAICAWAKFIRSFPVKSVLTSEINGKPITIQVVKVNV